MGNFASKLGPVTGYWILIISAILLAKVFNWVNIDDTLELLKYIGVISAAYVCVFGIMYFTSRARSK